MEELGQHIGGTAQPCDESLAVLAPPQPSALPEEVKRSLTLNNSYAGMWKVLPPLPHGDKEISRRFCVPSKGKSTEADIKALVTDIKAGSAWGTFIFDKKSLAIIQHFDGANHPAQIIGKGCSGLVTAYRDHSSSESLIKKHLKDGKKVREQEIMSMFRLDHVNICKVLALMCCNGSVDIIMEDAGRSLRTFFKENSTTAVRGPEEYYGMVQTLACQGFTALEYMHQRKVFHLDLKPDNILVKRHSKDQLRLVIADFGSSLLDDQQISLSMLTPAYFAPELCDLCMQSRSEPGNTNLIKKFLPQSFDTYAMGLTVYFMCSRRDLISFKLPKYFKKDSWNFIKEIKTHTIHIPFWATEGPFVFKPLPQTLQNLLRNTLHGDSQKRWTDSQAVKLLSGKQLADEDQHQTSQMPMPTQVSEPYLTDAGDDGAQDIDVRRKVRPAQLVSVVQVPEPVQAVMNMMSCDCPLQLNSNEVLMELEEASNAEREGGEARDFDFNREMGDCKRPAYVERDKGISPDLPQPLSPTSFFRKDKLAFTPSNPGVSKNSKAVGSKIRSHPYFSPQLGMSAGRLATKNQFSLTGAVPGSGSSTPAVHTKDAASATVPPPAVEAGGLYVVTRMPFTVQHASDRPLDPWAVAANDRVRPPPSEPPDVGMPVQHGPHAWPQNQEGTNIPRFDLLL